MPLNVAISFIPFFRFLIPLLVNSLELIYRRLLPPPSYVTTARCFLGDLTFTPGPRLICETPSLRHQLGILKRQVERPNLKRRDRFALLWRRRSLCEVEDAQLSLYSQNASTLASCGLFAYSGEGEFRSRRNRFIVSHPKRSH